MCGLPWDGRPETLGRCSIQEALRDKFFFGRTQAVAAEELERQRVLDIVGEDDAEPPESAAHGHAVVAVPQEGDPDGEPPTAPKEAEEEAEGEVDLDRPIKISTGKPSIGPTGKGSRQVWGPHNMAYPPKRWP